MCICSTAVVKQSKVTVVSEQSDPKKLCFTLNKFRLCLFVFYNKSVFYMVRSASLLTVLVSEILYKKSHFNNKEPCVLSCNYVTFYCTCRVIIR